MASLQQGTTYRIVNVKAGTLVDVSGVDNRSVIGYTQVGGDNQHWELSQNGDGKWLLRTRSGAFLAVEGEPGNYAKVVGQGEEFGWDIWPGEEDPSVFKICIPGTPFVVDLSDHGNSEPGTPVHIWEGHNNPQQFWRFEQV